MVHKGVGTYHLHRKTEKMQLENQMVRAIPYGKASENVGCGLGRCNVYAFWSVKLILIYCVVGCSHTTSNFIGFTINYAQDFHLIGLYKMVNTPVPM